MQEYCPLCARNGLKKKIRLLQLNLQEAAWACESEDCIWPWGYHDIQFISRKVGKTWSFNWENGTTTIPKTKEPVKISTELSLYTPPVTPSSEAIPKEQISSDIPCSTVIPTLGNQDMLDIDIHNIKKTNFTKDLDINKSTENGIEKHMPNDPTETCLSNKVDTSSSKYKSIFDVDDMEWQDNYEISNISLSSTKNLKTSIKTNGMTSGSVIQGQCKEENLCSHEDNISAENGINITQYPMRESEISSVSNYKDESHMNASCSPSDSILNIKMSDTTNIVPCSMLQPDTTKTNEKNITIQNNSSVKSVPTIRSVEKTNLNITKVVCRKIKNEAIALAGSNAAFLQKTSELQKKSGTSSNSKILSQATEQTTKLLMNSSPQSTANSIPSLSNDKYTTKLSIKSSDNSEVVLSKKIKPPMQVTTMEIDGLPPITLTYEMPEVIEEKETIKKNVDEKTQPPDENVASSTTTSENNPDEPLSINEILKKSNRKSIRSSLNGIKYEKFNFSEVRKKMKQSNNSNAGTSIANNISSDTEILQSSDVSVSKSIDVVCNTDDKCSTRVPINECQAVSQCSTPVESNIHVTVSNIPSAAAITPDKNAVLTPNINIDSLLDSYSYLVNNSQDLSQTLNDDWLESLLN